MSDRNDARGCKVLYLLLGGTIMILTIDLKPEIESALREEAAKVGLDADRFIQLTLEERLKKAANCHPEVFSLSSAESKMLKQINEWLPSETWDEYQELREKFRADRLTNMEHQRLTEIYDQIEMINTKRIGFIAELARLRQVSLEEMMRQLGIPIPSYD
jgi:hypothetical protein